MERWTVLMLLTSLSISDIKNFEHHSLIHRTSREMTATVYSQSLKAKTVAFPSNSAIPYKINNDITRSFKITDVNRRKSKRFSVKAIVTHNIDRLRNARRRELRSIKAGTSWYQSAAANFLMTTLTVPQVSVKSTSYPSTATKSKQLMYSQSNARTFSAQTTRSSSFGKTDSSNFSTKNPKQTAVTPSDAQSVTSFINRAIRTCGSNKSMTVTDVSIFETKVCYPLNQINSSYRSCMSSLQKNCTRLCEKYLYSAIYNTSCLCFQWITKHRCDNSRTVKEYNTASKTRINVTCKVHEMSHNRCSGINLNFFCVNKDYCPITSQTTEKSPLVPSKQTTTKPQNAMKQTEHTSTTFSLSPNAQPSITSTVLMTSDRLSHHDITTTTDDVHDTSSPFKASRQSPASSHFTASTTSNNQEQLKQTMSNGGSDKAVTIGATVVTLILVITGVIIAIYLCRRKRLLQKGSESEYMQSEDHIIKTNGVSNANYVADGTLDAIRNSPARASTENEYAVISDYENMLREKTYADKIPVYHTLESAPKDKTNNPQTVIKAELAGDYKTGDAVNNITVYHTFENAPNDKINNHHADNKTGLTDDSRMEDAGKGIPVYHTLDTDTSTGCKPPNTADANFPRDGNTIGTAAIYHVLENDILFQSADGHSVVDEYELAQSIPEKNGVGSGNRSDSDQIEMYHVLENSNQQMSGPTYELACIQQPGSNYEATGNDTSKEKDEECLDEDYCHLDHGDRVVSTARDSTYAHAHEECYDDGTYSHTTQGGHEVSTDLHTEYSYSHAGNGLDEDGDYSHMMDMNDI